MDNDLSKVIDRTDLIENLLDQVIHGYTEPRQEAFDLFWSVLLDSSIISLSSKIKVANAIAQKLKVKLDSNSLQQVIKLRNAFAHHRLGSHPTLVINENPEEDETKSMLHTISWSGKINRISRRDALTEFNSNYETAKSSLNKLIETIKSQN